MLETALRFMGLQSGVAWSEKLVSAIGGTLAIFAVFYSSWYCTGYDGSMAILPSMGACGVRFQKGQNWLEN